MLVLKHFLLEQFLVTFCVKVTASSLAAVFCNLILLLLYSILVCSDLV